LSKSFINRFRSLVFMKCISSDRETVDAVKFPCPSCGEVLVRSLRSRKLSIPYTCPKCSRRGP
jgi:predicted RNA-binding Zn-ribbon protein involved in translation (DUF1610 family)